MARIRTIKPEFWTSEQVVECSTIARLLFIGMWNFCDDQGIHPAKPKTLKMEVFPSDNFSPEQILGWIEELKQSGLLIEFQANGQRYWQVTGWHHQKIDRPNPRYPNEGSPGAHRIIDEPSPPEGKGGESKGRENNMPPAGGGMGVTPSKAKNAYTSEFEKIWKAYPPTNGSKAAAFKSWKKKFPKGPPEMVLDMMEEAIRIQGAYRLDASRAGEFVPQPPFMERWITEERWTVQPVFHPGSGYDSAEVGRQIAAEKYDG